MAQVDLAKEAAAKTTKDSKKTDSKGKKVDSKKKDGKKPLQASDNSVKKTGDNKDGKKGPRDQKPAGDLAKENRGPRRQEGDRPPRQQGDRPPRQQGDRPPRPQGDRPPRRSGEGFGRPQGDRPPRQNRQVDADGNVIESAEGGEGFRGGFRGPRGAGSGGYRGNNPRGPRRDGEGGEGEVRRFDRHSGSEKTGIKAVDKKDGAGKGNWGTATDEVVIEETLGQAVEGDANKDWAERVDENEEKKEGDIPEEDTPNFMTLEEYKALKSQINKRNDFNIRRPGEGEDQSKWGKTYLLPKKADEEDEEDESEEEEEEEEDEPEDVQKKELIKSMQSAFKFESTNVSERGGRGDRGRGGARGGARRDGERREFVKRDDAAAPSESSAAPVASESSAAPVATDAAAASESARPMQGGDRRGPQGGRGGQQGGRGGQSAGGRGGRGGARPAGRGPAGQKSAPKIDDDKDFPSLGQ